MRELLARYRELISYGFWGVMSTLVNYGIYFFCTISLDIDPLAGNAVAWVGAVAFAFVVNKQFVFASRSWRLSDVRKEAWQFVSARLLSGAMEMLLLYIFVRRIGVDDKIVKIAAGILVILLNYIISKWVIFRKPSDA